jgi:hypothetical protein
LSPSGRVQPLVLLYPPSLTSHTSSLLPLFVPSDHCTNHCYYLILILILLLPSHPQTPRVGPTAPCLARSQPRKRTLRDDRVR